MERVTITFTGEEKLNFYVSRRDKGLFAKAKA